MRIRSESLRIEQTSKCFRYNLSAEYELIAVSSDLNSLTIIVSSSSLQFDLRLSLDRVGLDSNYDFDLLDSSVLSLCVIITSDCSRI